MRKLKKRSYSIGVDLGGTNVRAGLVDGRRIVKLDAKAIRSQGSAEDVFEDLCSVIDSVLDKRVRSLGIGVPSLVDPKNGAIFDTVNIPAWKNLPLKRRLEKRYGFPVAVNNDANCFALGERRFGAGRKFENFVGLVIGTGLGAGIISRGQLHSGRYCGAGEFGTIGYLDSIVEHYASGQFFRKFGWDGEQTAAEARRGNAKASEIFGEFGHHLGQALKLVLYALAPEAIVLGGSVSHSFLFFEQALRQSLEDFAYPAVVSALDIRVSKVKDVAVLGAASLTSSLTSSLTWSE